MSTSPKLLVERMEDRLTPAMFGHPWLSPQLTISFAPDGTAVDGVKSNLSAALAADGLSAAQWQGEMLRAFQSWAAVANVNFGVVPDGGQAVGVPGRVQRDTRFGDVRVTARPLVGSVLAITTPPGYSSETRAGDIVLNTNFDFGVNPAAGSGRYDLYTVMLQEVGHALGVGNDPDPASVMYEKYQAVRSGLSDLDIAAVRSLYGGRKADAFEGTNGNDAAARAGLLPTFDGTTNLYARGDVTTPNDVDVFSFTTPKKAIDGAVSLTTAGVSLLAAKLELVDGSGKVVAVSGTPAAGANLELALTGLKANTKYFVRVTSPSSGGGYRTGGYDLRVIYDPAAADPGAVAPPVLTTDAGTNDTLANATRLTPVAGSTALALYRTYGQIETWSDVDVYRVTAPTGGTALHIHLASYSSTANVGGLAPQAEVFDATGTRVSAEDLTYGASHRTYQVRGVTPGADYIVAVKRYGLLSSPNYELTAAFTTAAVNYEMTDAVSLSPDSDTLYRTLSVSTTQVFTLNVGVNGEAFSSVRLDVLDSTGQTVHSVVGYPGAGFGSACLLTPGEYTVRLRATFPSSTASPLRVTLRMASLTDPIGLTAPSDPTTTPTVSTQPPDDSSLLFDWTAKESTYYAWLM
jgi:hypothetical protein